MMVRELIEKLKALPQDAEVLVRAEHFFTKAEDVRRVKVQASGYSKGDACGELVESDEDREKGKPTATCVVIEP